MNTQYDTANSSYSQRQGPSHTTTEAPPSPSDRFIRLPRRPSFPTPAPTLSSHQAFVPNTHHSFSGIHREQQYQHPPPADHTQYRRSLYNHDTIEYDIKMFHSQRDDGIPRRARLNSAQHAYLQLAWEKSRLPDKATRDALAIKTNLTSRQVQVWFQNQRQKEKKMISNSASSDGNDSDIIPDSTEHSSPITHPNLPHPSNSPDQPRLHPRGEILPRPQHPNTYTYNPYHRSSSPLSTRIETDRPVQYPLRESPPTTLARTD